MKTSQKGLDLIKEYEGLRTEAYRDPVGVWTIGYGHTSAAGNPIVVPEMRITETLADSILRTDLAQYETAVNISLVRVPSEEQFSAMVSLCFNIGPGNFQRSSVVRYFNSGDRSRAADSFLLWNKAGGKVLDGLKRRREAERRLFLTLEDAKPVEITKPSVQPSLNLWDRFKKWFA